jgi:hypothetical protein
MAISIIGSILLGAFLGQFYKVFILVPVIALVLAGEFGKAIYFGLGLLRPLFEFALISTSLQIGYIAIPAVTTVFDLLQRTKVQRRQARASMTAARHR